MLDARTAASILVVGLVAGAGGTGPAETQKPGGRVSHAGATLPAGWRLLVSDGCRFAVPASWHPSADQSEASAPEGAGNVSIRRMQMVDWPRHKAQIRAAFGHVNVLHEDSDRRFWFEIGDEQRITHYVAVHDGSSSCIALVQAHPTSTLMSRETTNRIIDSIRPASVN
jgi:hypothetical protein